MAKERFPRAPSEKVDWVKAGNKESACFSAGEKENSNCRPKPALPLLRSSAERLERRPFKGG